MNSSPSACLALNVMLGAKAFLSIPVQSFEAGRTLSIDLKVLPEFVGCDFLVARVPLAAVAR